MADPSTIQVHTISVVVPVFQGQQTLRPLVDGLRSLTETFRTPAGREAVIAEVLLVYDNGPDDSASVIRELCGAESFVRAVWLSRNFGQHPATLAGMASSGCEWIVTMDEDGQHDPAAIGPMLDTAVEAQADVVFAKPTNPPPHGMVRNAASRAAKRLLYITSGGRHTADFNSFRLILGEVGRSVAAYAGMGVYLDVAIGWVSNRIATCPVVLRGESGRPSGYNFRSLVSHFWRMVISSGTRALRIVSLLGLVFAAAGVVIAAYVVLAKLVWGIDGQQGWASLMVAIFLVGGTILFSLGVIAEYIGVSVNMAMGKPLYLIVSDPSEGPLGRVNDRGDSQSVRLGADEAPRDVGVHQ